MCDECERLRSKITNNTLKKEKESIIREIDYHLQNAESFYKLLKNNKTDQLTISFDMMQNQILPKSNISSSYFCSKLFLYVFGITIITKENEKTHFYLWKEGAHLLIFIV